MNFVGILHQPRIPGTEPLAEEVAQWLAEREVRSWVGSTWDESNIDGHFSEFDLLVVLGGDGSTLRAARLITPYSVPIFGINLGRVGFLSEAQPGEWREKLTRVLDGEHWIERRLRMQAFLLRDGEVMDSFVALNDVVLGRGQHARVIRLHLLVDGDLVTTYVADALIVATPTGSTAYAMAAGGPLLPPQLQNFVVVPVAAHLSLNRALVLHEEAEIVVRVEMDHEANLTADGQQGAFLQNGDRIVIQKHDQPCLFARVESSGYFYRRLMRRLGFSWPKR
ncbi:MAG: NAD(+) kinase [Chloroflexi bacterium]|jgi:NAD+ kinase|nr:NAD(+) kinase [Chloroflexota bacterium]